MRGPISALDAEGETIEIAPDEDGDLVAYVFKTLADPYAGRLNLFRVYSGVLKGDSQVTNVTRKGKERIGQLLVPKGKEHEQVDELGAGDIGAVAKLKETRAGDVLDVWSTGGGGYGHPHARSPEAVLDDVLDGLLSIEKAAADYGVVVDPHTLEIDQAATQALRTDARAEGAA